MSSPRRWVAAVTVLVAVTGVSCGSAQDDDVRAAADAFYDAAAAGDGAAACALLAPRTRSELTQSAGRPCPGALLAEDVPAVSTASDVRAFGTMAQVRYGSETTFLTRTQDGWRVFAAGCVPGPRAVFDCRVSGG